MRPTTTGQELLDAHGSFPPALLPIFVADWYPEVHAHRPRKEPLLRPCPRYANVGTKVGGVAARIAGRASARRAGGRAGNALALAAALGGLKGPIMKVAQLLATIPGRAAAGIRRRTDQAAKPGAADGLGLRQAPHAGRAWRRLAEQVQRVSSIIRRRPLRSARCIARPRSTARELACKLQYPDMQSAVEADLSQLRIAVRRSASASTRRSTPARSSSRDRRAPARGTRLRARGAHVALYRDMLQGRWHRSACRASGPNSRPAAC